MIDFLHTKTLSIYYVVFMYWGRSSPCLISSLDVYTNPLYRWRNPWDVGVAFYCKYHTIIRNLAVGCMFIVSISISATYRDECRKFNLDSLDDRSPSLILCVFCSLSYRGLSYKFSMLLCWLPVIWNLFCVLPNKIKLIPGTNPSKPVSDLHLKVAWTMLIAGNDWHRGNQAFPGKFKVMKGICKILVKGDNTKSTHRGNTVIFVLH